MCVSQSSQLCCSNIKMVWHFCRASRAYCRPQDWLVQRGGSLVQEKAPPGSGARVLMMVGPGFHVSPTILPSQANTSELGRRHLPHGPFFTHCLRSITNVCLKKKEESRRCGEFPAARLSSGGLTGLLNPCVKSGTKLFQPYVLNCFNCASSLRQSSNILEGPGLAGRGAVYVGAPRPIRITSVPDPTAF